MSRGVEVTGLGASGDGEPGISNNTELRDNVDKDNAANRNQESLISGNCSKEPTIHKG